MDQEEFDMMPEAVEEEEDLDPNNPDNAFAILKRNYNKTISEMEEDPAQAKYMDEFTKLFDFLVNVHEQANHLVEDNQRIQNQLEVTEDQLKTSAQTLEVDKATISELNSNIEDTHKLIDNAHTREQVSQETIDNLRRQILNLNAEMEYKKKMEIGILEENPQDAKNRASLEREKIKLETEVSKLNEKLSNALAYQEEVERRTSSADNQIIHLRNQVEDTTGEVDRFKRNKCRLELSLANKRDELDKKKEEMQNITEQLSEAQKKLAKSDGLLKEQTQIAAKVFKELEGCNTRFARLQTDYDKLLFQLRELQKDNISVLKNLGLKEEEKERILIDMTMLQSHCKKSENKISVLDKEMAKYTEEHNKQCKIIVEMEKTIDAQKRQVEAYNRKTESSRREKDILNRNVIRLQAINKNNEQSIKTRELQNKTLEDEVESHSVGQRKQLKEILHLHKEHERIIETVQEKNKLIDTGTMELHAQKTQVSDIQKSLSDRENKLQLQQTLYNDLQVEKKTMEKALQNAQGESKILQERVKSHQYQIEQLKEEMSGKDHLIIQERGLMKKLAKEKDGLKIELSHQMEVIKALKQELGNAKREEKRLNQIILINDKAIGEQYKTITTLMNERDILSAQLMSRNDELALLYEKVKLLQTILHRGEAQYQQRLEDIKLMKLEIKRLRHEKSLLTTSINNINDLKQEVLHLERELTRERAKNKALEEEMHNPLNVHRWRKLEGSDPEVFELLQKINLLQKQIFRQSSAMMDRERQLQEANKLYMHLRKLLAKQPGPDVLQRLENMQRELMSSTNKMKMLMSELDMVELQNKEYNMELTNTNKELTATRRKLVVERKKRAKDLEALRVMTATAPARMNATSHSGIVKYAGGGFRMAVSASAANLRNQ